MKTVKVVAAIIQVDGRIYTTQRGCGPYKDGWGFPGGKIEPGETPEQALVQEIKEELDTIVEVGSLLTKSSTTTRNSIFQWIDIFVLSGQEALCSRSMKRQNGLA